MIRDPNGILDRDHRTSRRYIFDHAQFGQAAIFKHPEFEYLTARVVSSFEHENAS